LLCNVDGESNDDVSSDDDAEEQSRKKRAASLSPTLREEESNADKKTSIIMSDNLRELEYIQVEGCGVPRVNGTYKTVGTRNGPRAFVRSDIWGRENIKFEVVRTHCGMWQIWAKDDFHMVHFFYESTIAQDLECYQLPVRKRTVEIQQ
jgi:hypothetical protein